MCRIGAEKWIALCSALLVCVCASYSPAGDSVTVNVTSGTDVGIGFDKLTEGAHDLQVTLHAVDGYTISHSNRADNTGLHLWAPEEITTPGTDHVYSVAGVAPNDGHSVRFHGDLAKTGNGTGQAIFNMAVADLDIDADTNRPPAHCGISGDVHWPPTGSSTEDFYEADTGYGLRVPRIWASTTWPTAQQAESLDYKILRVSLNAKNVDSTRTHMGMLKFHIQGAGVAIYCGQTSRSPAERITSDADIVVPNGGIFEDFRIVTNMSFTGTVTITATFEWDSDLRQSGVSAQAVDDLCVSRVRVIATAPEGRFVATGHYSDSIPLEAVYEFPSGNETYAWTIENGGTGDGTLENANTQTPTFTGTEPGTVNVKVTANGYDQDTLELVAIDVNDLAEGDPDATATEVYLEGDEASYAIPYSTSSGDLRGVYIAPPEDPDDPYEWDSDFDAVVSHLDGTVTLTLSRSGPYLVKVVRDLGGQSTSEFLLMEVNCGVGKMEGEPVTAETWEREATPTADLILVSIAVSPNDNGYLVEARKHYPGAKSFGSVHDAALEIAKYPCQSDESKRITVLVVEHGNVGLMTMGSGTVGTSKLTIDTTEDLDYFTGVCKNRVRELTHTGCSVGLGDRGGALLEKLSQDAGMKVWAVDKATSFDKDGFRVMKGFKWVHKP